MVHYIVGDMLEKADRFHAMLEILILRVRCLDSAG